MQQTMLLNSCLDLHFVFVFNFKEGKTARTIFINKDAQQSVDNRLKQCCAAQFVHSCHIEQYS